MSHFTGGQKSRSAQGSTSALPSEAVGWTNLMQKLLVCGRSLRQAMAQQHKTRALSETQFALLWACHQGPLEGISQIHLAQQLAISPAQVSGLVEQLRKQGLLAGHRAEHDRRVQLWQLTPAGRALIQAILQDAAPWVRMLDSQLTPNAQVELSKRLDQLSQVINDPPRGQPQLRTYIPPSNGELTRGEAALE